MSMDEATLTKLDALLAAIRGYEDPRRASTEWKQVYRLLQNSPIPPGQVTGVVGMRDVAGLEDFIKRLRAPAPAAPAEIPDEETCKKALKAFRRRLDLTVLDEQSKLGRSPLSKGDRGIVHAIVPPDEWPDSVWHELARQGKLRDIGHGFYELVK
jgi:hypothetical protein